MDQKFCQSCGMPLKTDEDFGLNTDQSRNDDYCHFCFADGKFTQDLTMDQMIEHCAGFVEEFNKDSEVKYTKEEAIVQMKAYFPKLKRWANT
ncbi:zinc ribbon domain-containing protein [Dysgonomonas sp. Marseille-P4677]|uniref:zinc ribbon domain-containing protein n=1 Tax=Dysgonomonas sp. Marseille-P4677 TaxID=2364790 RepID=UPI001911EEFD|nr:zinc ribbon domain-containing protein [Dysgonomonas sp. Marseille-P4677]MBK5721927.1 zinc ribbon domain-containing protein [Dysgonomonas sp. Marseille-P4677]